MRLPLPSRTIALVAAAMLAFTHFGAGAATATTTPRVLKYAGINLAGAEFNSSKKPGVLFKDYTYPSTADYAYFASKHMNIVRLPFLWERLQPIANGPLDPLQLSYLKTAVSRAKANGMTTVLDVHNYSKYYGQRIGTATVPPQVFADLWRRLAAEFRSDPKVLFGLMNEPNGLTAAAWAQAAQAGVQAIRSTGADNMILVPGVAWSGAHSWTNNSAGGGTSNGTELAKLYDPLNRMAFEVHQYLDKDYSGTASTCVNTTIGADKLVNFTNWLRANKKVGFLGEFGASTNATCMAALDGMLKYMQSNSDVWLGWSYWAAGGWWTPTYPFNVQPNKDGSAKPQMKTLYKYAKAIAAAR